MSARFLRKLAAFTLIELLVVVSIIVLLLAILVPSLSRAKELTRVVVCKSNLHQQGVGMQTYVATYGAYPGHCGQSANGTIMAIWPTRIRKFAGGSRDVFNCLSQPEYTRWQRKTGSGGQYATAADVTNWSYELDELLLNVHTVPFAYAYNDWGACGAGPRDTQMDIGGQKGLGGDIRCLVNVPELKSDRVRVPQEMIAIGDNKVPDGSWDFNMDPTNPNEYPGSCHSGGADVLFADGHTTWMHLDDLVVKNWTDEKYREIARRWNNHNWWNAQEKGPTW